jgi:hypothetical protein
MNRQIKVIPAADGGNPRNAHDIIKREDDFYIFPFSEDGDANYKFHMNVQVQNDSNETIPVKFTVNWGDEKYQVDRKYLLLCTDDDNWQSFDTEIHGPLAVATVDVPPGISYLSLHPRYEHARLSRLAASLPRDIFHVEVIGTTRMRRDILGIEAGSANIPPVAFYARVHPYETIGSYFIEGMLKWLAGGSAEAKEFIANNHVVFVPMPNVDGVADGTNKLTHGGLNFSVNFRDSVEPEAIALKNYFSAKKPSVVFDLHSWNNPRDNMVTNDPVRGRVVYEAVQKAEKLFTIPVEILYRHYPDAGANHSCAYFTDIVGSTFINSSWPHVGRSSADLYAMGVLLLKAIAEGDRIARNTGSYKL